MIRIILLSLFTLVMNQTIARHQKNSNKHFCYTIKTDVSSENIWQTWINVNRWNEWDEGLRAASLNGDFQLGAKGVITSLEGQKSKFKVVDIDPGKFYTIKTRLPLGSLYVKRFLKTENGMTHFTHEVWFKGLTGGLFAKKFGPKFRALLPKVMENVEKIAKN